MFLYIFFFVVVGIVVNGVILETVNINISNDTVSWKDATRSGHTLLSSDYVLKHGWNNIALDIPNNPSGSRYWIGARATHTPFVSWEGCVQWIGGPECGETLPGGSIGDCLKNCGEDKHYILLMDTHCRCVPRNYSNCFNHTHGRCNRPCPNNPNDWCGSNDKMSLYYTDSDPSIINKTHNDTDGNCATIIDRTRSHTANQKQIEFQPENCMKTLIRRYICRNESFAVLEDNKENLEWSEAYELCRQNNLRLHYNASLFEINGNGIVFWTSLRRSFLLEFTNNEDEHFPFCVSISVDNFTVNLHEERCDREHRYLYWSGNKDGFFLWRRWYPLLAVPIGGLLLIAFLCRVFLMGKGLKESLPPDCVEQERPAVASEHDNNTVEERPSVSAPHHMYHILDTVDSAGNTVRSHDARNINQMSLANTTLDSRIRGGVPRLISDPGSVYNTTNHGAVGTMQTSNNVYNTTNCRGFATSMPSDYVSFNVYNVVRNIDTDVYDNADTFPKMAVVDDMNPYDHIN